MNTNFQALAALALSATLSACSTPTTETTDSPEVHEHPTPPPTVLRQKDEEQPRPKPALAEPTIEPGVATLSKGSLATATEADTALSSYGISAPRAPYLPPHPDAPQQQIDTERYPDAEDNPIKQVLENPVSTFSIDVDTAAYANARRQLHDGRLPSRESVRVEEFINYFNYDYPRPPATGGPFSITTEVGPSPWNSDRKLMLVGLQGYEVDRDELPPANLVFLVDVSGSMNRPNKLGLLKSSLTMLTKRLRAEDTISIAVYAGAAGEVLAPTSGREASKILQAIDSLNAGGSTNGGAGIQLAYSLARKNYQAEGINRVILATDGDFNVGTTDLDDLRQLIEKKRESGVSLTVLGFGAGNYNDALMQELAQKGNGNASYIDSINEARKVLVDEMGSTLQTIAKDVKIQVEFNPERVLEYRLIGYETRALRREDFNNDAIDAGEIGAGHSVTALYELTLTDANSPSVGPLRYGSKTDRRTRPKSAELAHVKLRYKAPNGNKSKLLTSLVNHQDVVSDIDDTSVNFRFASAAGAFGQLLRGNNYTGAFSYTDALALARKSRGKDDFGYRHEFEQLLRTAAELAPLSHSAEG